MPAAARVRYASRLYFGARIRRYAKRGVPRAGMSGQTRFRIAV